MFPPVGQQVGESTFIVEVVEFSMHFEQPIMGIYTVLLADCEQVVLYSFMASCKNNNVNEFEWLKDVFERIQSHKQKVLYQLLPLDWEEYRIKA